MSRQLEQKAEERTKRRRVALLLAVDGGLADAIERAGGELLGFGVRLSSGDCLITLRVRMPAGRMIAFVGAEDLGEALIKATRDAVGDRLRWRPDKYASK